MTIQFKLGISVGLIACLLTMALIPSETESSPVGWGGLRHHHRAIAQNSVSAVSIISYQTSYRRRKTF
jgi:hypothetical protein